MMHITSVWTDELQRWTAFGKKKTIGRKDKDPTEVASTGIIIIAIIKKTVCA